jgi:hypothetical protein
VTSFRESLKRIVMPRWAQGPKAQKFFHAVGARIDVLADQLYLGLRAGYPSEAPDDALPHIGRDRGIVRGFAEPRESYEVRLRSWIYDRKRKGNPYTLMRQLAGYLTPHATKIRIVNNRGAWYTRNADGTTEYHLSSGWDWDGHTDYWARFWVVIYPGEALWLEEGSWDNGALWGDGGVWGSSITYEQAQTLRLLVNEWRAAHSSCPAIILAFDPTSFDPTSTPLDGLWGNYSKNVAGVQVASRLDSARYLEGVP